MRTALLLVLLLPAGIGAADAPLRVSLATTPESRLNEKRKAIHDNAVKGKDIPVPDIAPVSGRANSTSLNPIDELSVKKPEAAPKKKSGWLWGGDDDDDSNDQDDDAKAVGEEDDGLDIGKNNDKPAAASVEGIAAGEVPDGTPIRANVTKKEDGQVEGKKGKLAAGKEDKDKLEAPDAKKSHNDEAKRLKPEDQALELEKGDTVKDLQHVAANMKPRGNDTAQQGNVIPVQNNLLKAQLNNESMSSNMTSASGNDTAQHQWNSLFKKIDGDLAGKDGEGGALNETMKASPAGHGSMDKEDEKNELQGAAELVNVQKMADGLEISLGDPGNPDRWAVMQRAGLPSAQFKCGTTDSNRLYQVSSLQAVSSLLVSDDSLDSRVDLDDSEDDIWNLHRPFHLLGGGSGEDDDGDTIVQLINFTLTTEIVPTGSGSSSSNNASDVLQVYTSPMVEGGGLVVTKNDNVDIIYVCKAAGTARVKLQAYGNAGASYCFEWVKHCKPSWDGFQVLETGTGKTVAEDGRVTSGWQPATTGTTVSFMLTHPGSEGSVRLKGVSVTSNNPQVNVTLRGALDTIINETAPVANIITIVADIAEQVDVIYSCEENQEEQADVVLKFYNEASAIPPLEIPWTAHCSKQAINDISASISSCRAKKNSSSLQQSQAMFKGDVSEILQSGALTIAADDDCTALLFTAESPDTVIDLSPSHQILYDRKLLMVANKVGSVETTITGDTLLRIPYICLDDGVSDVALTVYFKNKSSADFHWKKACQKPGVHTSAMLTGRHIFAIIMALFLSSFLFCFISRSRTLTQFILRKLGACCPWCCGRRQSLSSDERTQFTAFGVAV